MSTHRTVRTLVPIVILGTLACGPAKQGEPPAPPAPRGDYLGQPQPGPAPELFAPGLVSSGLNERDTAFAPDGSRLLYTLWGQSRGTVIERVRHGEAWSDPEVVAFSGTSSDIEPCFDPSGDRLLFASQRPLPGESEPGDWNLWQVALEGGRWGTPRPLPDVNGPGDEYYPSLARDGTLYFTARLDDGNGGEDLYRAEPDGDGYSAPRNLGGEVNSPGPEFNAFVSPDESWLIFGSVREGDQGGGDLYVSFRTDAGGWTPARAMGPSINSAALDYCPFVTADGRWLFFTSQRSPSGDHRTRRGWDELVEELGSPGNGQGDLYWVDAGVIETLR